MLKIREAGFNVVAQKEEVLTEEMAHILYKSCADKEYYNELIEFMTRQVEYSALCERLFIELTLGCDMNTLTPSCGIHNTELGDNEL